MGLQSVSLRVADLDLNVTDTQLYEHFSQVGEVVSVRVCRDLSTGMSLGYGCVNYSSTYEDAERDFLKLCTFPLNNKPIRIWYSHRGIFLRSGEGNIIIKNLDKAIDREDFQFDSEKAAQLAISQMNGKLIYDKSVKVEHVHPKDNNRDAASNEKEDKNIYAKNLDHSIQDDELKKHFSPFGEITSLQHDFNGMTTTSVGSHVPMDSSGASVTGQKSVCAEGSPAMITPQTGFRDQQQVVPGMRPGDVPLPSQQRQCPVDDVDQVESVYPSDLSMRSDCSMEDIPRPGVVGGMYIRNADTLPTGLANLNPEHQKKLPGESPNHFTKLKRVTEAITHVYKSGAIYALDKLVKVAEPLRSYVSQQKSKRPTDQQSVVSGTSGSSGTRPGHPWLILEHYFGRLN